MSLDGADVDLGTGEVRIVRLLGAQDSGRVMNLLTYRNQVFGGITMGIGYVMTEARVLDVDQTGRLCNRNWHDYKLPTALDVPADMACVPIDVPDDEANTAGAKVVAPFLSGRSFDRAGLQHVLLDLPRQRAGQQPALHGQAAQPTGRQPRNKSE